MPTGRRSESPEPPEWWSLSLYDFLANLPLEGWIWEFMRRARLKEELKGSPVVAMLPKPKEGGWAAVPELNELNPTFWNYYERSFFPHLFTYQPDGPKDSTDSNIVLMIRIFVILQDWSYT
jgi:hypothetical protein